MKFKKGYIHREKKNQHELVRVHERNFGNPKLMRPIVVVYSW